MKPVYVWLLLVVLLGSCSDSGTGPTTPAVILPLAVGNMWVGDMILYNPVGTVLSTRIDTTQITRDTTIGSDHWYRSDDRSWLTNRDDGAYEWIDPTKSGSLPKQLYKYPAAVGDSYQGSVEFSPGTIITVTMTVEAIDTTVTVGDKAYHCYRYRQDGAGGNARTYFYLDPNGGFVRMEGWTRGIGSDYYLASLWQLRQRELK